MINCPSKSLTPWETCSLTSLALYKDNKVLPSTPLELSNSRVSSHLFNLYKNRSNGYYCFSKQVLGDQRRRRAVTGQGQDIISHITISKMVKMVIFTLTFWSGIERTRFNVLTSAELAGVFCCHCTIKNDSYETLLSCHFHAQGFGSG